MDTDRRRQRAKPLLFAAISLAYLLLYLLGRFPGSAQSFAAFIGLPVGLAGWYWGRRGGAIGAGGLVAATFLLRLPAEALWGQPANLDGFIQTLVYTLVFGVTVGSTRQARDRSQQAGAQLEEQASSLKTALATTESHLAHETALVHCSQMLLGTAGEEELKLALHGLIEATSTDYLLVERNVEVAGVGLCSRPLMWVARDPTWADPSAYWRDAPWAEMPLSHQRLSVGEAHHFSWLDELPEPERTLYANSNPPIRAEIDLPIMVNGRWEGIIGFAHASEGKQWDSGDVELLRTIAGLFGAFWARQQAEQDLMRHADEQQTIARHERALADCSAILLGDPDDGAIESALRAVLDATSGAQIFLWENHHDPERGFWGQNLFHLAKDQVAAHDVTGEGWAWSSMPLTRQWLSNHQPVVATSPEDLAGERIHLVESGIESELIMPIVVGGRWVGAVGLGDQQRRQWADRDLRMMRSVAGMFATFWARRKAHQELEDLIRAKDRFIASVSHELRTPLTAVIGLAAELADNRHSFADSEVEEFVRLIANQSREVGNIVEDLLVAARASEAQLTIIPDVISLGDEVRRVLGELPGEIQDRIGNIELPPIEVEADPLRVRQIIRNLLTNAYRYGGDPIEVRVSVTSRGATLRVVDQGSGIPPELRETVFQAYRTASEMPGRTASIGLGLTVSRQLARLMGGDVTYRYDGESIFELTLPVTQPLSISA